MVAKLHHVFERHKRRRQLMNWISTVEPAPWTIAGFELGPLRFGHCLLIERFMDGGQNKIIDLWRYLNIASRTYEKSVRWLTKDVNTLFPVKRWAFCNTHKKPAKFEHVLRLWNKYVEENTATPSVMMSEGSGTTIGTPYLQTVWNICIHKLNYNPQTIKEAPFGEILWAVLAYNESQGGIRVVDDNLEQVFEKLKCQNLN